ncbi:MAG TPA: universal stress protein [Thermoplasmata archaeon]|jgi:nucleotide-binding universal stress UspA family protein
MAFRSVLVADDMLDASQAALDEAVNLAKLARAKLTIVTVISVVSPSFGVPVPIGDSFVALMESATKRLEALKQRLVTEGVVEVETALLEGNPVDRVVEFAEKHRPDLIVVGSRGLSTAGRFLLGSVSDGILHHVHCSVLVVKSHPRPKAPP